MREEKASSSDGSELDRRVFVSRIESSFSTRRGGGDADLPALSLDGEGKKFVSSGWDGDDFRGLFDF